jgi:hypothetical protein
LAHYNAASAAPAFFYQVMHHEKRACPIFMTSLILKAKLTALSVASKSKTKTKTKLKQK